MGRAGGMPALESSTPDEGGDCAWKCIGSAFDDTVQNVFIQCVNDTCHGTSASHVAFDSPIACVMDCAVKKFSDRPQGRYQDCVDTCRFSKAGAVLV